MVRKRLVLICGVLLAMVAVVVGILAWALFQVPDFYKQAVAEIRNPAERKAAAETFAENTTRLADEIKHSDRWSQSFTQMQINAWLAEELPRRYAAHVPRGVSAPRVQLVEGALLVGFRYQHNGYSSVVSVRLKPSVPAENMLAVQIESIRAGLLPIAVEDVLDQVTRGLRRGGWPVEWTKAEEDEEDDVALVSLDRRGRNRAILESIEVREGLVRIGGRRRSLSSASGIQTAWLGPRRFASSAAE